MTVVRGSRDRLCPSDWAATVAAAAPCGRLVQLPGAAHMRVQTHPDEVAALLAAAAGTLAPGVVSSGRPARGRGSASR